jgi:hypothetical protein
MHQIMGHPAVTWRNPHRDILTNISRTIPNEANTVLTVTEPPKHHLHAAIATPAITDGKRFNGAK